MLVTFPTCHVERSQLKAAASLNTAPHSNNKEKPKDTKMGRKKKRERASFNRSKIELVQAQKRKEGKKKQPK